MNDKIHDTLRSGGAFLLKNKYVFLVLILGVILLLIPTGSEETEKIPEQTQEQAPSIPDMESRLSELLSLVQGAGEVRVLLRTDCDGERILAADSRYSEDSAAEGDLSLAEENSVLVISGDEGDRVVTVRYEYPRVLGAVVLAQGADSGTVRLDLTEAVKAATGLTADKIKVIKMK